MNKIYTFEYTGLNTFDKMCHFVIVVAASNSEVARAYVKEKIGIDTEGVWLMNATYPTIYSSNGATPLPVQAKILSNLHYHEK
jgi:hypothetical protein